MAVKKSLNTRATFKANDWAAWNFIIFLTLSLLLLVVVLSAMNGVARDLRSRALGICPAVALPRPEDCPGGKWEYKRGADGCEAFFLRKQIRVII